MAEEFTSISPHEILDDVASLPERLKPMRERILSNLTMLARMPSYTGEETQRVRFLLDRFTEAGITDAQVDDVGNAVGRLRGYSGRRTILLVAHLDTIFPSAVDHNVTVQSDRVLGPGVGDNALGAAVVAMMPVILDYLNVALDSDLLLLGSIGSLGRGNHKGLRFFLDQCETPINFGICVEGMPLGRLNFFSIGTVRADIICEVRPEPSRSYGSESALVVLNQIINRILAVSLPSRPFTKIKMGILRSGVAYDVEPDLAQLGLEVVSHSDEEINRIVREIEAIVSEMSARHAVNATLDPFFHTKAGGISFSHPLVGCVLDVMQKLGIPSDQGHSPSELSELIGRDIPAVTLGITHGEKAQKRVPDYVLIDPMLRGVAQLVAAVLAIDGGACDDG